MNFCLEILSDNWQLRLNIQIIPLEILSGINRCRWRSPFLLRGCYGIGCRLRIIFWGVALSLARQPYVFLGAAWQSPHPTYLSIAPFLVLCGILSGVGLECQVLIRSIWLTISSSLLTLQVTQRLDNPSTNLFGYFVFGWFGMNVIIDYIIISKQPLSS